MNDTTEHLVLYRKTRNGPAHCWFVQATDGRDAAAQFMREHPDTWHADSVWIPAENGN